MIGFRFHPQAKAELKAIGDYYEAKQFGLETDFLREAIIAIDDVRRFPHAWPVLEGDLRHRIFARFPFSILYSVEEDHVLIIAIMDGRREPGYWKDRLA